jgi:hypothetical protein
MAQPYRFHPQLEAFEDRFLPSVIAAAATARPAEGGADPMTVVYKIDNYGMLRRYESDSADLYSQLSTLLSYGPFTQLSAGDAGVNGTDCVLLDANGAVWLNLEANQYNLIPLAASGFTSVKADIYGNILGLDTNGAVWLNRPVNGQYYASWIPQAANAFVQIDAGGASTTAPVYGVTTGSPAPLFWGLDTAGNIWTDTPDAQGQPNWMPYSFAGGFKSVSAGAQGDAVAIDIAGTVWEKEPPVPGFYLTFFVPVTDTKGYANLSVGFADKGPAVFALDTTNRLWIADTYSDPALPIFLSQLQLVSPNLQVKSVSASRAQNEFAVFVTTDGKLYSITLQRNGSDSISTLLNPFNA